MNDTLQRPTRNEDNLLDRAGVPTIAPPILEPRHVDAILGWNRTIRQQAERTGLLRPLDRVDGEHARYRTVDVARVIVTEHLRPDWSIFSD